jgi:hypothetical protein
MNVLGPVVLTLLLLLPVRWQPGRTATNDPKAKTVVDANGTLRPAIIAPPTSLWAAGQWQPTKARVQRRSTSSMHRPEQAASLAFLQKVAY